MNKILLFITVILFFVFGLPQKMQAQFNMPTNNVWAFGNQTGMKFDGPNPTTVATSMYAGEGCASVSNDEGELLFYSNGNKVWSANGNLMPHGQNLDVPASIAFTTTQAAFIMPIVNDANKFYLFTLGDRLFCYRIDMTLNGGLGDVDTTFSLTHVALKDSLTEKMIGIQGCDNNVWVIVKSRTTGHFFSYNVTMSGVDTTPVVSVAGFSAPGDNITRTMRASNDGHKIALNAYMKLELLNFDITNGKVSNGKVIDNQSYYGSCFSQNDRYLYCNNGRIYQYDLWACDPAATRIDLGGSFTGDVRLAPNGKIYFRSGLGSMSGYKFLGSIEYPNIGGTGCQYRDSVTGTGMLILSPPSPATSSLGFPNTVVRPGSFNKPLNRLYFDTCICQFPHSTGLILTAASGFSNYQWSDGSSASTLNAHNTGTYWVSYQTNCGRRYDTFAIKSSVVPVTLAYNAPLLITSGTYQSYKWYKDGTLITGAMSATYQPSVNGIYSVVVANAQGCTDSAFLHVTMTTGIGSHDEVMKVSIYPNPATDMIYIESKALLQALITDLSGRVLMAAKSSRAFDVSTLQTGIYLVKIMNEKGGLVAVKKFTKMSK